MKFQTVDINVGFECPVNVYYVCLPFHVVSVHHLGTFLGMFVDSYEL